MANFETQTTEHQISRLSQWQTWSAAASGSRAVGPAAPGAGKRLIITAVQALRDVGQSGKSARGYFRFGSTDETNRYAFVIDDSILGVLFVPEEAQRWVLPVNERLYLDTSTDTPLLLTLQWVVEG